jgi:hypothetical protein
MARKKVVTEVEEEIVIDGIDVTGLITGKKNPEDVKSIDWLTMKNKLNFVDYVELRAKFGLEG